MTNAHAYFGLNMAHSLMPAWLAVSAQITFAMLRAPCVTAGRDHVNLAFRVSAIFSCEYCRYFSRLSGQMKGPRPFPRLRPNKTCSGLIGSAVIVAPLKTAALGFLLWLACVIGDLYTSRLKHITNVKDFSAALGAPGWFADRMDSLVIATALMASLTAWFGRGAAS